MYTREILERFKNPENAGVLRGSNGTGKSGEVENGDVIKIYILVDENGVIENAKFKAYGGVSTIVACDVACEMLIDGTTEDALRITSQDIIDAVDGIPENREYVASLVEEAIKNAVEDYFKKKEKEEKKNA